MQPTLAILAGKYVENKLYDLKAFSSKEYDSSRQSYIDDLQHQSGTIFDTFKVKVYTSAHNNIELARKLIPAMIVAARIVQATATAFASFAALALKPGIANSIAPYFFVAICITAVVAKVVHLYTGKYDEFERHASNVLGIAATISVFSIGFYSAKSIYVIGSMCVALQAAFSKRNEKTALNELQGEAIIIDYDKLYKNDQVTAKEIYVINNKFEQNFDRNKYKHADRSQRAIAFRKKIYETQINKSFEEIKKIGFPKFTGQEEKFGVKEIDQIRDMFFHIRFMLNGIENHMLNTFMETGKFVPHNIQSIKSHFKDSRIEEMFEGLKGILKEFDKQLTIAQATFYKQYVDRMLKALLNPSPKLLSTLESQKPDIFNSMINLINLFDPLKRSLLTPELLDVCIEGAKTLRKDGKQDLMTKERLHQTSSYEEIKVLFPEFALPQEEHLKSIKEGVTALQKVHPPVPAVVSQPS